MTVNRQLAMWCRQGHAMTDENTYWSRSGEPRCRICLRRHLSAARRWRPHPRALVANGATVERRTTP